MIKRIVKEYNKFTNITKILQKGCKNITKVL